MTVYLCHVEPDLHDFDATVLDARPGGVLLSRSALHPGGGGQVSDEADLEHRGGHVRIVEVAREGDDYWHVLDAPVVVEGDVHVRIDRQRRSRVAQLHTASHVLNALVFDAFSGALVTGAQINADGSARMDFDLPNVDNDLLRKVAGDVTAVMAQGHDVRFDYVPEADAAQTPGLIRSLAVAPPPTAEGTLRIVDIVGVDRQACGGTHLGNTADCAPVQVTKVESKGRHNRRVRLVLAD